MDIKSLSTKAIGDTGEYYVAAELTKRGYTVTIAKDNTHLIDLIVINPDGTKTKNIQVKTTTNKQNKWKINKKCEQMYNSNLWYVFVKLDIDNELAPSSYHICASSTVASRSREYGKQSRATHVEANKKRSKRKKIRRTSTSVNTRYFIDEENKFVNNWKNLNLD